MPQRVQSLRSSVKGSRPTGRLPGEIYTNFADRQIGFVNASNAATDLVAVRYFSAAADYAIGDYVVQAGVMYRAKMAITSGAFNIANWDVVVTLDAASGSFVLKAGDTMTGALVVNSTIVATSHIGSNSGNVYSGGGMFVGPTSGAVLLGPNSGGSGILLRPSGVGSATGEVLIYPDGNVVLAASPAAGDNDTSVATTAHVKLAIAAVKAVDPRNRLVNPAFQIGQEIDDGVTSVPGTFSADQWQFANSGITGASGRIALGGRLPNGSNRGAYLTCSVAKPTLSGSDYMALKQIVEGINVADLMWGSANAKPVVLRFWALATATTGTYTASIRNGAGNRSYLAAFTIPAINTWYQFVIPIPGDTTGTWDTGEIAGLQVTFCLAAGTGWQGVAGWQAGANLFSLAGAVNGAAVTGTMYFADIGLYLDPNNTGLAPPWQLPDEAEELRACQRYYWKWNSGGAPYATVGASYYLTTTTALTTLYHPVTMRIFPAVAFSAPATFSVQSTTVTAITADVATYMNMRINATTGAVAAASQSGMLAANASSSAFIAVSARM